MRAKSIDKQFLWGPALLISPVLEAGQTKLNAYLPDDIWYDYHTVSHVSLLHSTLTSFAQIINCREKWSRIAGTWRGTLRWIKLICIFAAVSSYRLKIRLWTRCLGGYIVHFYLFKFNLKLLPLASRLNPFGLIVAIGSNNAATGDLFWDDGETIDTVENNIYQHHQFTYSNVSLSHCFAIREGFFTKQKLEKSDTKIQ